jgi:hypothetical protein
MAYKLSADLSVRVSKSSIATARRELEAGLKLIEFTVSPKLGRTLSSLQSTFNKANDYSQRLAQSVTEISARTAAAQRHMGSMGETISQNARAYHELAQSVIANGNGQAKHTAAMRNAEASFQTIAAKHGKLATATAKTTSETKKAVKPFETLSGSMATTTKQSKSLIKGFTGLTTASIGLYKAIAFLSDATQEYLDRQDVLVATSQIMNLPFDGAQIKSYADQVKQYSKQYKTSLVEIGDATNALLQADIDPRPFIESIAQLSKSSEVGIGNLRSVTDAIILLENQGFESDDIVGSLDKLVTASKLSSTAVQDLLQALSISGSYALNELKQPLSEYVATIATLQDVNRLGANINSTAIRTIYTRLAAGHKELTSSLAEYGVELSKLTDTGRRENLPVFEQLTRISDLIQRLGPESTAAQKILRNLGGVRRTNISSNLVGNLDSIKDLQAQIEGSRRNQLFDDAIKGGLTFRSVLRDIKNEFQDVMDAIGESSSLRYFLSTTKDIATSVLDLAESFGSIIPLAGLFFGGKYAIPKISGLVTKGLDKVTPKQKLTSYLPQRQETGTPIANVLPAAYSKEYAKSLDDLKEAHKRQILSVDKNISATQLEYEARRRSIATIDRNKSVWLSSTGAIKAVERSFYQASRSILKSAIGFSSGLLKSPATFGIGAALVSQFGGDNAISNTLSESLTTAMLVGFIHPVVGVGAGLVSALSSYSKNVEEQTKRLRQNRIENLSERLNRENDNSTRVQLVKALPLLNEVTSGFKNAGDEVGLLTYWMAELRQNIPNLLQGRFDTNIENRLKAQARETNQLQSVKEINAVLSDSTVIKLTRELAKQAGTYENFANSPFGRKILEAGRISDEAANTPGKFENQLKNTFSELRQSTVVGRRLLTNTTQQQYAFSRMANDIPSSIISSYDEPSVRDLDLSQRGREYYQTVSQLPFNQSTKSFLRDLPKTEELIQQALTNFTNLDAATFRDAILQPIKKAGVGDVITDSLELALSNLEYEDLEQSLASKSLGDVTNDLLSNLSTLRDGIQSAATRIQQINEANLKQIQTLYAGRKNIIGRKLGIFDAQRTLAEFQAQTKGQNVPSGLDDARVLAEVKALAGTVNVTELGQQLNNLEFSFQQTKDSRLIPEIDNVTRALELMANSGTRVKDKFDELSRIRADREERIGVLEKFLTSDARGRLEIVRQIQALVIAQRQVSNGARLQDINPNIISEAIKAANIFGDINIPGTKIKASDFKNKLLGQALGFQNNKAPKEQTLENQIQNIQKESVEAAKKLYSHSAQTLTGIKNILSTENQKFLNGLRQFYGQRQQQMTAPTVAVAPQAEQQRIEEIERRRPRMPNQFFNMPQQQLSMDDKAANGFRLYETTVTKMVDGFNNFVSNFPRTVEHKAIHDVRVTVNGNQVLNAINDSVQGIVTNVVNQTIAQVFKEKLPELGPVTFIQRN